MQLITEKQLASMLSISVQTLRNARFERRGFPYVKLAEGKKSAVRYDLGTIQAILSQRRVDPEGVEDR